MAQAQVAPHRPGLPIEIHGLTKRFGAVTAVNGLSFSVAPGRVTGFLGPNGAGKTTTLRMLLGLVRPTSGTATVGGEAYAALTEPFQVVGSGLDGAAFHPARSGHGHLVSLCLAVGVPSSRATEALETVELGQDGGRKVKGYSLGMRQRLALAGALLTRPPVLVLDEPANGLDPVGIAWLRSFLRSYAAAGATVLVSSHVLSEVEQTVDDVVVINRGALAYAGPVGGLRRQTSVTTRVDAPDRAALAAALRSAGLDAPAGPEGFVLAGVAAADVGKAARDGQVALSHLSETQSSLESAFLELVGAAGRPS